VFLLFHIADAHATKLDVKSVISPKKIRLYVINRTRQSQTCCKKLTWSRSRPN